MLCLYDSSQKELFIKATVLFLISYLNFSNIYGQQQKTDSIKVGVLHSITGTMAISERSLVDATLLAIEIINSKGGINGKFIKPIVEDGASDWNVFTAKAEKLISKDKVCSIFGCWTSASRKAVLPIIEHSHNLLWYPLQYEGGEASKNIIYSGATPNQQIFPALDWCLKNIGKRFFLVGSDYIFPREANKLIKSYLKNHGGVVTGEEYIPLGDQNFKNIIRIIQAEKPDVIFNTVNGDSNIGLFLELYSNFTDKTKKIPVMSVSIAEEELRSLGTKLTVGNYCSWTYFQSIDTPHNKTFVDAFKKRYGQSRVTSDPIEAAYMQVFLFAEALKKSSSTSPEEIKKNVLGLTISAPSGNITIDPDNQHAWKFSRIAKVTIDGQFDILSSSVNPIKPEPFPEIYFPNGIFTQQQRTAILNAAVKEISLSKNNAEKIGVLNRLLNSKNKEEIAVAFEEIQSSSFTDPALLPSYILLLDNEDEIFIQNSIDEISKLNKNGFKAIPKLIDLLQNSDGGIRLRAQLTLTKFAHIAIASDDISFLNDFKRASNIIQQDADFVQSSDFILLKQSIKELDRLRQSSVFMFAFQIVSDSFWLKILIAYFLIFLFIGIILLRISPLTIYVCNNFIQKNFNYILLGDINISESIKYLLIVGFFYNSKRVLDAWVNKHLDSVKNNFTNLDTVKSRSVYIPVPIAIDNINKPDFSVEDIRPIFNKKRWCILRACWGIIFGLSA